MDSETGPSSDPSVPPPKEPASPPSGPEGLSMPPPKVLSLKLVAPSVPSASASSLPGGASHQNLRLRPEPEELKKRVAVALEQPPLPPVPAVPARPGSSKLKVIGVFAGLVLGLGLLGGIVLFFLLKHKISGETDSQAQEASSPLSSPKEPAKKDTEKDLENLQPQVQAQIKAVANAQSLAPAELKPQAVKAAPKPAVVAWIQALHVQAFVKNGDQTEIMVQSKLYKAGDLVEPQLKIYLLKVKSDFLYFKDEDGLVYKAKRQGS